MLNSSSSELAISIFASTSKNRIMTYSNIIQADQLKSLLGKDNVVILDCRRELGVLHIQGAQIVDFEKELTGKIIKGITGRHPLPRIDDFAEQCGRWGIDESKQVIIYDEKTGAWASRLWWMLRWLGHEKVAVLNGGWDHWVKADLPTTSGIIYPQKRIFKVHENRSWIAHRYEVQKAIQGNNTNLVDSRAAERYRGEFEPIDPIAGHIPTALNLPFSENLNDDGLWRPSAEIEHRLKPVLPADNQQQTIFYCGSGVTACHNILASQYADLPMPRLYVGSWSDWINTMGAHSVQ